MHLENRACLFLFVVKKYLRNYYFLIGSKLLLAALGALTKVQILSIYINIVRKYYTHG